MSEAQRQEPLRRERLTGPQHNANPAAPSMQPARDKGEPSRVCHGEGHGRREAPGDATPKNPSGYGERNGQMVGVGTGEALSGPCCCGQRGRWRGITGEPREISASLRE